MLPKRPISYDSPALTLTFPGKERSFIILDSKRLKKSSLQNSQQVAYPGFGAPMPGGQVHCTYPCRGSTAAVSNAGILHEELP